MSGCHCWRYYGSGGGFWLLGILMGFALYLSLPHLFEVGRSVLIVASLIALPLVPLFGIWFTRRALKDRARRRRNRQYRLANPSYADSAYIV